MSIIQNLHYSYSDLGYNLCFFSKFQELRAVGHGCLRFYFIILKQNITRAGLSIVYSVDVQLVLYKPATYSLKKYIIQSLAPLYVFSFPG